MIDVMNELKDGQVFTLHPSEEITSKMGGTIQYKSPNIEKLFGWHPDDLIGSSAWHVGAGCTAEQIEQMAPVAKGNPGAMNYLLELRKEFSPIDFQVLLLCLKAKELTGPDFYLFVKNLGVEEAARQMKETWLR